MLFEETEYLKDVSLKYYLIAAESTSVESADHPTPFEVELPKAYIQITSVLTLDFRSIVQQTRVQEDVLLKNGKRRVSRSTLGKLL